MSLTSRSSVLNGNNKRPAGGSPIYPSSPSYRTTNSKLGNNNTMQLKSIYNSGNDSIEGLNRFSFPAISFSPSLPLRSPGLFVPSPSSISVLSPRSPNGGIGNGGYVVLSPRAGGGAASLSPCSPYGFPQSASNCSGSGTGSQSRRSSGHSYSPGSPLPPLSPRGQKLADSERLHNVKCYNRIVEKRRKASDGTQDIVIIETVPIPELNVPESLPPKFQHSRKVSFKLSPRDPDHLLGISLPSSLPSSNNATAGSSSSPSERSASSYGSTGSLGVAASVPTSYSLGSVGLGAGSPFAFKFSFPNGAEKECLESAPSSPIMH